MRTPLYKTAAFALSGAIACLAGALYGTHASFVAPSLAGVLFSTEVVVWVAIGGRASLLGALLGGILVASLSNYLSAVVPRCWQLALGVLFVLVVVYLRGGVAAPSPACSRAAPGIERHGGAFAHRGLTKRFQGLVATDHVDFQLASSELRCIIGPNGAGKTTFISMISGPPQAERRRHLVPGRAHHPAARPRPRQAGIGRKFQTPSVFDNLSVFENIELAVLASARGQDASARIARVLHLVRLEHQTGILARNLSHGQRQWLEIGLLLANDVKLLLLDAHRGHDRRGDLGNRRADTAAGRRAAGRGDHHRARYQLHPRLRAPITVMHLGRVLVEGAFDEIERNVEVREVYLGAVA